MGWSKDADPKGPIRESRSEGGKPWVLSRGGRLKRADRKGVNRKGGQSEGADREGPSRGGRAEEAEPRVRANVTEPREAEPMWPSRGG